MKLAWLFLLAASALHFEITDARGKRPSGVTVETSNPDADGWYELRAVKSKGEVILVWPYDARAKAADGPEAIPALVIEAGDAKALLSPRVIAAVEAGEMLGSPRKLPVDPSKLADSEDPFQRGVGLLYAKKPADAVEPLARALRERERQLTRVPSEIYPVAMLYGQALMGANKFDDAAVAFLKALKQRPSSGEAKAARADALIKAGKPEAAAH